VNLLGPQRLVVRSLVRAAFSAFVLSVRLRVISPWSYLNWLVFPLLFAIVGLYVLSLPGAGSSHLVYGVLGGGLIGYWSVAYIDAGNGIQDERWNGTLEQIFATPTPLWVILLGKVCGGLLFGRSFIAIMFDQMFNLTPQGWRILTMRWALFFMGMAILNEIIWRTQSTDFWVAFKAFGVIPLTMAFAISQMPLTRRYHLEPASLETSEAEAGDVSQG